MSEYRDVNVMVELTVQDALSILRNDYGSTMIGEKMLYLGIETGAFPFGVYIPMGDNRHIVFENQLREWAEQRTSKRTVPVIPVVNALPEEIEYV